MCLNTVHRLCSRVLRDSFLFQCRFLLNKRDWERFLMLRESQLQGVFLSFFPDSVLPLFSSSKRLIIQVIQRVSVFTLGLTATSSWDGPAHLSRPVFYCNPTANGCYEDVSTPTGMVTFMPGAFATNHTLPALNKSPSGSEALMFPTFLVTTSPPAAWEIRWILEYEWCIRYPAQWYCFLLVPVLLWMIHKC